MERGAERLLRINGFRARVDWPRTPPVAGVRKPPAHLDHSSRARFGIPHDDWQQSAYAIGDDFLVAAFAAWFAAATVLRKWLRECYNFTPGCQRRELSTHVLSQPY
jgi:hypothetical protein